jgi:hypothetical protein
MARGRVRRSHWPTAALAILRQFRGDSRGRDHGVINSREEPDVTRRPTANETTRSRSDSGAWGAAHDDDAAHVPPSICTAPISSMSLGASKTMEKMLAPAKVSTPVHWNYRAIVQPVQDTVSVGEERVAAFADEQPAWAGLNGHGRGIEAHRGGLDEHFTTWLTRLGFAAGGVVAVAVWRPSWSSAKVKLNATSASASPSVSMLNREGERIGPGTAGKPGQPRAERDILGAGGPRDQGEDMRRGRCARRGPAHGGQVTAPRESG